LAVAQRLQIGRFHANLVIAAILHEQPRSTSPTSAATPAHTLPSRWHLLATLAITQGALLSVILFTYRWLVAP
jgi:hypothetical protein